MMMEESIYNLIPKEEVQAQKPPMHTSRFKHTVREETKQKAGNYRTMGPAKVSVPTTNDFLKKHEKEPKLARDVKPFQYPDAERKKPVVPAKEDRPLMGLRTTKDFIKTNAVENIMSIPRKADKNFVDTKGGDKQPLEPSGLEPIYVHKKEYGKTPGYLVKREREIVEAQEEYNAYIAEHFRRGAMKQLSDGERQSILHGLKSNWEELHHQYQGLSMVVDTVPKKNRKERLEAGMKQLERDIETIEKHTIIYIAN